MKATEKTITPTPRPVLTIDRPPIGWHALNVMKSGNGRKWDWMLFMVDVDPDELKHCHCKTAWLYVHPKDYKPVAGRVAQEVWVRIPGKHRNEEAAWEAAQAMIVAAMH